MQNRVLHDESWLGRRRHFRMITEGAVPATSARMDRPDPYATDRCLRLSRCVVPAHIPTRSGSAKAGHEALLTNRAPPAQLAGSREVATQAGDERLNALTTTGGPPLPPPVGDRGPRATGGELTYLPHPAN
jgi:hypothetical protein